MKTCILRDYDPVQRKEVIWLAFLTNSESRIRAREHVRWEFFKRYHHYPQAVVHTGQCWQVGPIGDGEEPVIVEEDEQQTARPVERGNQQTSLAEKRKKMSETNLPREVVATWARAKLNPFFSFSFQIY